MKRLIFIRGLIVRMFLKLKTTLGIAKTTFVLSSGEKFSIRNYDRIGLDLINGEGFEDRTKNLVMNSIKKGMTVLDIGANIGYYTVKMANLVGPSGRVLAFEPNPTMVAELKSNIEINNFKNVEIHQLALGSAAGKLPFFNPAAGNEGHGSLRQNNTFQAKNTITVDVRRLDETLAAAGITRVDFIKIDVEGAEYEVLSGAKGFLTSGSPPVIVFESAENLCYAFERKVYDTLKLVADYGYEIENVDWGNWIARPLKK